MSETDSRADFLWRVGCRGPGGRSLAPLGVGDPYVARHISHACEAVSLRIVRLARDPLWEGYMLRLTPGGVLLADGHVERAAAAVDSGTTPTRLSGDGPEGPFLGLLLRYGQGLPLDGAAARSNAAQILHGLASGHLTLAFGRVSLKPSTTRPDAGHGGLSRRYEGHLPTAVR